MAFDWIIHIVLCIGLAFLITEIAGYFIHQLLHSNRVQWLSKYHMLHHLRDYAPGKSLRSDSYICSAKGRAAIFDLGLEWVIPIAFLIIGIEAVFIAMDVSWFTCIFFPFICMAYGHFSFGIMHDYLHLKDHWILRNSWLRKWFLSIRRYHDLHHMIIDDDGRMKLNYGISFFFMDKLLGTFTDQGQPFNEKGYQQAQQLYDYALSEK